jgi:NADH-quinone oxidoreductase subunit G
MSWYKRYLSAIFRLLATEDTLARVANLDLLFVIKESIPEGIQSAKGLIVVLQTNITASVKDADIAVPIKAFAEQSGSFTNKNGAKQNFEASMNPVLGMPASGDFFRRLSIELSRKEEVLVGNN